MPLLMSILTALATTLPAQAKEPATDLSLHTERLPGIEVHFVDFHWRPELFDAMEKGGSQMPEAQRNWMLARVVTEMPFTIEKGKLEPGSYVLALWPNLDGKGMAIELRRVNMATIVARNVIATAPEGQTMVKVPARFETVTEAPRLAIGLSEQTGVVTLEVRYGNRRLPLKLTR